VHDSALRSQRIVGASPLDPRLPVAPAQAPSSRAREAWGSGQRGNPLDGSPKCLLEPARAGLAAAYKPSASWVVTLSGYGDGESSSASAIGLGSAAGTGGMKPPDTIAS
jgi:hypothetical protein